MNMNKKYSNRGWMTVCHGFTVTLNWLKNSNNNLVTSIAPKCLETKLRGAS